MFLQSYKKILVEGSALQAVYNKSILNGIFKVVGCHFFELCHISAMLMMSQVALFIYLQMVD